MTLNLALSYGGRNEMMRAVRDLAGKCVAGELDYQSLSEEMLGNQLDTAGQPDPDLLIRTGGEHRLSNFLLWQTSYSELYFTDTQWPEFGKDQLLEAIAVYGRRQRRFGKTGAQLHVE
jgi:undecaprenyl diphosphate synthase